MIDKANRNGEKQVAKELKYKIKAEETKKMYAKIRRCRGQTNSGINRIQIPSTTSDEWITVDTPIEIENKLRERNQKHFGQAQGTFLTTPGFCEKVDWGSSTHTAELILQGEYNDPKLNEVTQEFVSYMKKKTTLDTIPATLTPAQWKGKIKSWKESTSTSPSGFHLNHSKTLIAKHGLKNESPKAVEIENQQNKLISWQVQLLNLAINNKHSFDRWKVVVNVMILKTPGDLQIHRLIVIHLYIYRWLY